jgi:hypothetical protein
MDVKSLLIGFVVTFVIGFFVTALVTWLWSLVFHGVGVADWQLAFVLAFSVGVAVPVANAVASKKS